ncbi:MAG: hypothetical protein AAF982_11495 [Pseudomonadota bacterium]
MTSGTLRFNGEGEATARGMGSDARSGHDQTLRCIDMAEGLDRSRHGVLQAVPAIAALPLAGMAQAETKGSTLQDAFRAFERLAAASVPEGYRYAGLCAMGPGVMISAEPTHPGRKPICMWPLRDAVWRPVG